MNIDLALVPTLWYEDKDGNRHVVSQKEMGECVDPPPGFVYQNSQFPNVLRHTVLHIIQKDEVEACEHPDKDVCRTYGWVDGVEGRKCRLCGGTHMRDVGEKWPDVWKAYGSRCIMTGNSSWSEDLVLAMASRTWRGWLRGRKVYTLGEAILIAANACERCMNALGDIYGLPWGYAEGSEEWENSGTRCQFCE